MEKYYKIVSDGVARFIQVDDINELKLIKKNFDAKVISDDNGKPILYSPDDIKAIQFSRNNNTVDNVGIDSIFNDSDFIASK